MSIEETIRMKYQMLAPTLNERTRRLWAATEAVALGAGSKSLVARATGLAFNTVQRGIRELGEKNPLAFDRIRRPGGGRKKLTELNPELLKALDRLVEPVTRGDPEGPLRWMCKGTRRVAAELKAQGHPISHRQVGKLLAEQGYSLQANRKTKEGDSHPDRNAQFEHINRKVAAQLRGHQPAVSVDTKKKELVGAFKNAGREWRPKGRPEEVSVHDFLDPQKGKAIPYGVLDLARNAGWVSVGVDHDTASFAVSTIARWWREMGRTRYRDAQSLLIVADCGGSNGPRVRLWKWELQGLADRLGIPISVCHLPPGTSKWNKIEHRLFSFISQNWRGKPLLTHATIVNLIANTTTTTGLTVRCMLDKANYPKSIQVSDEDMFTVNIKQDSFHGDWNYTIRPRTP